VGGRGGGEGEEGKAEGGDVHGGSETVGGGGGRWLACC